jgi:protocatechuate 3,4-dioxygenase beta subunit
MRSGAAILAVLVSFGLSGEPTSFGQPKPKDESVKFQVGPVVGTVADPTGQPSVGTKVLLLAGKRGVPPEVLQQTTTDARGRFQFKQQEYEFVRGTESLGVFAEDAQGRIGGDSRVSFGSGPSTQEVHFGLRDVKDYQGRLVDAGGKPIAKARIELMAWRGDGERSMESFPFSPERIRQSSGESAEDGSFTLRGVPGVGSLVGMITAEGFGSVYVSFTLAKPVTISLQRPGALRGSVVPEGKGGSTAGVTLYLHSYSDARSSAGSDCRVYYYEELTPNEHGEFRVKSLPPGKYMLTAHLRSDSPYVVEKSSIVEIRSGEEASLSVPLKRALALQGKVVDKRTRKGVQGVSVYFYTADNSGRQTWGKTATTDEQGAFTAFVKPGKLRARLSRVPEGYLLPSPRVEPEPVEVTKDMTCPTMELESTAVVEGTIVDEAGRPVAGAEVRPFVQDDYQFDHEPIRSDQAGKFVLRKGRPGDSLPIRVRSDKAVSDGPVIAVPGEKQEPLRIVVSEGKAFTLRGTLVDEAQKPVQGAQVHLWTMWRTPGGGVGFRLSSQTTSEDGRFEFRALWPGDQYHVLIEPQGFDKYQSAQLTATTGRTHDFGKIVLTSAQGVVEGQVVDSAGKPLAGVQVFNAGDASQRLSTATDAAGGFRLAGLRSGPVYVFVRHAGYRFTGVRTQSGAARLEIKLLRQEEPVPPRPASDSPSFAEQQQIARPLLEKLWKERKESRWTLIHAMARIDLEQAVQWAKQAGKNYERLMRPLVAERVAESDLEEALSLLSAEGARSFMSLKTLAERLAASDPAKALRCAEEAALQARNMDEPERAESLATAGRLVARLGNEAAGRELVEEAAAMVDRMGSGESQQRARTQVAKNLAPFDPERAAKLLGPIADKNRRERYLMDVAVAIAPRDLAKAKEILKEISPWYANGAITPIAYEVAQTRPDEALRILDELCGQSASYRDGERTKAEALGWVAVAIAPRDSKRAWALIDQAMELCLEPSRNGDFGGGRGGRPTRAAVLALQAQQTGYPDLESVVHRVLASRMTTKDSHSPTSVAESHVMMAMILAMVDPATAKEVLQSLEPQLAAIGSGGTGIGRDEWFKAWALADPRGVPERVRQGLAAKADEPDRDQILRGVVEMVELLTIPPGERLKELVRWTGIWIPGEER